MKYATETLEECIDDIIPLLDRHYAEIGFIHAGRSAPIPLALDLDAYRALERAGLLRAFTARLEHRLVGYAAFIVANSNLHHNGLKYAANDVLSVVPEHRGLTGSRLMAYCERELRAEGVQLISLSVPVVNDWRSLAARWGYETMEYHMHKWIG